MYSLWYPVLVPQMVGGAVVAEVTENVSVRHRPALDATLPSTPATPARTLLADTVLVLGPLKSRMNCYDSAEAPVIISEAF